MHTAKHRNIYLLIFLAILAGLTFFTYQPGLFGPYVFDDAPNITHNPGIAIQDLHFATLRQAAFSSDSGPLSRPISMLSFALNVYANGLNNYYFKLSNLFIHILCGLGVFFLCSSILKVLGLRSNSPLSKTLSKAQQDLISFFVTAAWLLHPLCLTSVLYVVQRMTSLSALFCIWGMVVYLHGRLKLIEGKSGKALIIASLLIFTPLAALSKETGALLPLFLFVIELTLLSFETKEQTDRTFLIIFFSGCVALPSIAALAYSALHPQWITSGYALRDFTLVERLMTESRVLCFYLKLILIPSISDLGLFHDDIAYSHSLLDPVTTLVSIVAIILLLGSAIVLRKKLPILSFGILFFFAGHVLESSIFGLEIAHEHRNYLPMIGPVLAVFYYLLFPLAHTDTLQIRRFAGGVLLVFFAAVTHARSTDWANPFDLYTSEIRHHPNSAQTNLEMGTMLGSIESKDPNATSNNDVLAQSYYKKVNELNPHLMGGLIGLIKLNAARNRPIEAAWIENLSFRLRHSPLGATTSDSLISLITCRTNGVCKISNEEFEGLFEASLSNGSAIANRRAAILSAYSYYLVNVAADYQKAAQIMQQAIDSDPGQMEYRMTFVKFCIAINRFDEAKKALNKMQSLDKLKRYQAQIEAQSRDIADRTAYKSSPQKGL